jgi:mRNA interferase YafQ
MLEIVRKSRFKKDFKKLSKSGCSVKKLVNAIKLLAEEQSLPENYRDHALIGDYKDYREIHNEGDWLLIYQIVDDTLVLVRTGSHSELFG